MALRTVIKNLGLAKEYLRMSPAGKKLLDKYHYTGEVISVVQRETSKQDDPFRGEAFRVDTAARLLWVTAANAIPHGHWRFAEKPLHQALELANADPYSIRDRAHI